MKLFFILFLTTAYAQNYPGCRPERCADIQCVPKTCGGSYRLEEGAGYCGCCPHCVKQAVEGETCTPFRPGRPATGYVIEAVCTDSSFCSIDTEKCERQALGKRAAETCAEKKLAIQASLDAARGVGMPLLGVELPRCETDGSYSPYQCIGSRCECVTTEGVTISGYNVARWETQGMNCRCARDLVAFPETGLIRRLFQCAANGNYEQR